MPFLPLEIVLHSPGTVVATALIHSRKSLCSRSAAMISIWRDAITSC